MLNNLYNAFCDIDLYISLYANYFVTFLDEIRNQVKEENTCMLGNICNCAFSWKYTLTYNLIDNNWVLATLHVNVYL